MRSASEVVIPIPRRKNTQCKVEVNGENMTSRAIESEWIYPATKGIGTFRIVLANPFGQITGDFSVGDVVKFYADNTDATTLQFQGRIDHIQEQIGIQGQFLEINGRHRSYLLNESLICHSTTNEATSTLLGDIIDKLPSGHGFTKTNISTTTDAMSVEWNYKPFWECVKEICKFAGYDCYVDNDLDFNYFEANSISNSEEAIVEGDNLVKASDWGKDDYHEKTRITTLGKDDAGLPIIYTAIIPGEAVIREVFLNDFSANTSDKVQNVAEGKLEEYTNRPVQARILSLGLETLKPGENISVVIPRQQIYGVYKIIQIKHKFGAKSGGWRTECLIEEETIGVSQLLQKVSEQTRTSAKSDNINKMTGSFNFDFNDDLGTHSSTEITEGVLKTDGAGSGTWISGLRVLDDDVDYFEMRAVGESLVGVTYEISTDGGNNWQSASALKTQYACAPKGKNLNIRITLNSADTQIDSVVMLYK